MYYVLVEPRRFKKLWVFDTEHDADKHARKALTNKLVAGNELCCIFTNQLQDDYQFHACAKR